MTDHFPFPVADVDPAIRRLWGSGPWQKEPDRQAWQDSRTQLHCAMLRDPFFGSWCGYVAVAPDHPLHGKPTTHRLVPPKEIADEARQIGRDLGGLELFSFLLSDDHETVPLSLLLPAHGSLTYADLDDQNLWWFGFDCCHGGDWYPLQKTMPIIRAKGSYRDAGYVEGIVTRLAWAIDALTVAIQEKSRP